MTIFTLVVSTFIFGLFLLFLGVLTKFVFKRITNSRKIEEDKFKVQISWKIFYILLMALVAIGISFLAPVILTQQSITKDFDFSNSGPIGDTIGGLMNPFIGLAGVIVTGLAFYMQYKANLLQREIFYEQLAEDKKRLIDEINNSKEQFDKQFKAQENQIKLQQFEAQFYEMLRLHKENVNEIELFGKRTTVEEFNGILKNKFEPYLITKRNAFVELKKEFEFIMSLFEKKNLGNINSETITICYEYFFWGVKGFDKKNMSLTELFENSDEETIENILYKVKSNQYSEEIEPFKDEVNFDIKAFEGHSEFLGHYYRHLFHTVKFVVNQKDDFLKYKQKRNYLRVLRAQLSNHEQIMMFYNWLAGYGAAWENEKNHFFTEYCMIHNLWYNELFKNEFISASVEALRNKPTQFRKKEMFEVDA